jgi:cytochrome c-type biogenesis protein CcmH
MRRNRILASFLLGWATLSLTGLASAQSGPTAPPSEPMVFATEEQEASYQKLVRELRCTVCQNQNLIESNAPLAADLRRQISVMIKDGAQTDEVVEYMVARYGDFVLFRPPKNATTYLLWYGPGALMVIALTLLGWILWRRRSQVTTAPLSREEQERLRRLLDDDNKGSA